MIAQLFDVERFDVEWLTPQPFDLEWLTPQLSVTYKKSIGCLSVGKLV